MDDASPPVSERIENWRVNLQSKKSHGRAEMLDISHELSITIRSTIDATAVAVSGIIWLVECQIYYQSANQCSPSAKVKSKVDGWMDRDGKG
ncbi:unnamed protein product [Aspergillus oryzae]|nr:unnamed protein product [Aspergillus oryzae]GMF84937.1 unnamed protein product [Aspergillus oryzae]